MKRDNRIMTPGGTITRIVRDAPGRPIGNWVGTNDTGATASNPAGSGAPNNMVQITGTVYDFGNSGGDDNPTQVKKYVDASGTKDRVTNFLYDFRNRQTDTDGEIDYYAKQYFDNLNRVYKNEQYDTSLSGNLVARSTTSWNDRGVVFQTARYAVDPTTGAIGNALVDNFWRDAAQNPVKSLPAGSQVFTKIVIDSLGRATLQYRGYGTDANYAAIFSVANNTILEQTETAYDNASNAIQATVRLRYHNATATQLGALASPAVTPNARVTYAALYPDGVGRIVAAADYGTNGGTALSRSSTIPISADNCLVSSTTYNARDEDYLTTDPAGTETFQEFDDRGRPFAGIENYVILTSSSSSSSSTGGCAPGDDTNRETDFTYSPDGAIATITAVNATTGNQTTQNIFGTTLTESDVASSLLRRYEILPDSISGSDQKAYTYNRQAQITSFTDQNGTVHALDYDKLGRPTGDRITTLGSGVDNAVLRIGSTYEVRGLPQNLTSYDNATVGSGSVVNDVQLAYNSYWQLLADYQSHAGAVNVSTTPKVQYGYADGSANTVRPVSLTYPNGRVLNVNYGTTGGISDSASRVASLIDNDGTTHLADYSYLGVSSIVIDDYTQPQIKYTLASVTGSVDPVTGDIYTGLDLFGRVKDLRWYNYGTSADAVRIQHGYDRASNRLWRQDSVAESYNAGFDELYSYDGLYRLKTMQRGTLSNPKSEIANPKFAQCWTLDPTGNWKGFREDDNGSGTWNLVQSRAANTVNEITSITNSVGPAWVKPGYNPNGNMTTIPRPAAPTSAFTGVYDAWNRLVKLVDVTSGNTVQTNAYDGRNFRTIRNDYTAGVLSETRHLFYTSRWQTIEERVGSSTPAERQFVWGQRFIDDLVLRDRDTTGGGTLNERFFALQDPKWNVVALADATGAPQERYAYDGYGAPVYLTSAFAPQAGSAYNWETLYSGYRLDGPTGLYPIRERFLNSVLGTWLTRDPLSAQAPAASAYSYVLGRPTALVDPLGLQGIAEAVVCEKGVEVAVASGPAGWVVLCGAVCCVIAVPLGKAGGEWLWFKPNPEWSRPIPRPEPKPNPEPETSPKPDPKPVDPPPPKDKGKKDCFDMCTAGLGDCLIRFSSSRCEGCHDLCRANCHEDPCNDHPWPKKDRWGSPCA